MTIAAALAAARTALGPSENARRDAHLLLAHVLDVTTGYLYGYPERALTPDQQAAYQGYIARRATGEPLAYLLGSTGFYDRDFFVTPAVLIPRPETEQLLSLALAFATAQPMLTAVDIGTGSGALAVTLAARCPQAAVHAVDLSPAALAVARRNAAAQQARVTFYQGDLAEPLLAAGVRAALVMANLPYIASADLPLLEVSRHEPLLALDGGTDGLRLVARLLPQLEALCEPGALILLEIGAGQGAAAQALVSRQFPGVPVAILPDYAGHDRIVRWHVPSNAAG